MKVYNYTYSKILPKNCYYKISSDILFYMFDPEKAMISIETNVDLGPVHY